MNGQTAKGEMWTMDGGVRGLVLAALCLTGLLLPLYAHAQAVTVRAWVDEATVERDDIVVYRLQVEGERFGAVQTPDAPQTEGLALVQPYPSTQRSATITNGIMQQSLQFSWRYRPLREGTARIEGATVQIGKEIHTADPIVVRVVSTGQRPQRRAAPDPFDDNAAPEAPSIAPDDVFIEVSPSTTRAYQNEEIIVTYRLLFRPGFQFRQLRLADSWDAEGFWREEIEVDNHPIPETAMRNGERYGSIVLKRVALFATRTGTLAIDPLTVEADLHAPRRSRDPFGFMGLRGGFETARLLSPPLRITIQPLPDGAPDGYAGAVGQYRMTTQFDRTELEAGESTRLRVQISGRGNLSTLEPPTVEAPGAIEVYSPVAGGSVERAATGVSGTRTFEYALVPRANGRFTLAPVTFSYFDPRARQYRTLRGDGTTIVVTGEMPGDERILPADGIAGIAHAPGRWLHLGRTPLYRQTWPYAALAVPLLALVLLAGVRARERRLTADADAARRRGAHPLARKHLRAARHHLEKGEARPFYDTLEKALLGFVGARLSLEERGLTRTALAHHLDARAVPASTTTALLVLLDRCDGVRFSPLVPEPAQQQADYEEAAALLVALDPHLTSSAR